MNEDDDFDDDASDATGWLEGADEGCPNTDEVPAGLAKLPKIPAPDVPLPTGVLKSNMDLAGGGPAGVVVAAVFPKADPVWGLLTGVVLVVSAKVDPLTGVDGAGLALPNIDPLGVPEGVVLVVPNTELLVGVLGKTKADFAFGVTGASLGAEDVAPNADEPPTVPKTVWLDEPLSKALGCVPKPNDFGVSVDVLTGAAGVPETPKTGVVAGLGMSVSAPTGTLGVAVAGVAAGLDVTPKLNLRGALDPAAVDDDEVVGMEDAAGGAGLVNEKMCCDPALPEGGADPPALDVAVPIPNPPMRDRSEGSELVEVCPGFSSRFLVASGADEPKARNEVVVGCMAAPSEL